MQRRHIKEIEEKVCMYVYESSRLYSGKKMPIKCSELWNTVGFVFMNSECVLVNWSLRLTLPLLSSLLFDICFYYNL